MANTRNPKDIRGMVSSSERDVDDMKSNLDKLKNLSEDDKKENAMLRSRIDEQCQLIMILKQRADDVQGKTSTLERINKELIDFRSNAQEMLNAEIRKNTLLEKRFDELASNHQEMIKIKDEYKRSNQDLRTENSRLRDENARLFSGAIVEKDQQIADLEKKLASLKEQSSSQDLRQRQSLQDLKAREQELQQEIEKLQGQYKRDLKTLQSKLQDTEERLKGANYKLQNQMDDKKSADLESQTRIQSLVKEKDELLDLAMTRGKIIQKEQTENKKLQKRVEEMERAVRGMEDKFEREAATVNANLQVRKLRDELSSAETRCKDAIRDFEAFKKYSNTLLQKEKEINERLRHLAE
ncbi:coiled-coil domain-containing protein 89-like isoform X2 [Crassostrea virginica]|uniref:Coiled-coil domain-containing protein 89-like isoform X2 n=1 Tax=Crassostrea virginica TaxID=6565 RepID=A0A8B8BV94_CRAVI|nr:coiled-coil domain-containing protein 89-like isoform X2 [Crassostrea virginica]